MWAVYVMCLVFAFMLGACFQMAWEKLKQDEVHRRKRQYRHHQKQSS